MNLHEYPHFRYVRLVIVWKELIVQTQVWDARALNGVSLGWFVFGSDLWIFVGFDRVRELVNENYQIFLKLQNGKLKIKN